jgi:hypothetical protein
MTREELAWAAGLFEGEGCIYIRYEARWWRSRYGSNYLQLQLKMTDSDVVERFYEIVNEGAIYIERQRKNRKQLWRWYATNRTAAKVLLMLLPYLGSRRTAKAHESLQMMSPTRIKKTRLPK